MPITEKLALYWFWISFLGAIWIPLSWFLLSVITPKNLLNQYFKQPHFSLGETIMMAQFPGFLLRTTIFGWSLFFPKLTHKRQLMSVRDAMPAWYAWALRFFIVGTMLTLFFFLSIMGILFLMDSP